MNDDVRGLLNSADVRRALHVGFNLDDWWVRFNGNLGNPGNITTAAGTGVAPVNGKHYHGDVSADTRSYNTQNDVGSVSNNLLQLPWGNTTHVSHIFFTPGHSTHGLKPLF